ncbi:MAG: hypothetical protein R2765_10960 [Ferruginibacter sp.]
MLDFASPENYFQFTLLHVNLYCIGTNKSWRFNRDTKGLPGKWTGTMVFTADKEQVTYKSVLNITDMKDSMMFNFIHVSP